MFLSELFKGVFYLIVWMGENCIILLIKLVVVSYSANNPKMNFGIWSNAVTLFGGSSMHKKTHKK